MGKGHSSDSNRQWPDIGLCCYEICMYHTVGNIAEWPLECMGRAVEGLCSSQLDLFLPYAYTKDNLSYSRNLCFYELENTKINASSLFTSASLALRAFSTDIQVKRISLQRKLRITSEFNGEEINNIVPSVNYFIM